eukprot:5752485-Prorocentrum_lima.AAC.1
MAAHNKDKKRNTLHKAGMNDVCMQESCGTDSAFLPHSCIELPGNFSAGDSIEACLSNEAHNVLLILCCKSPLLNSMVAL